MPENNNYRRGDWQTNHRHLTDGSAVYYVQKIHTTHSGDWATIETIDRRAAIRLVNCLAESAA